MPSFISHPRLQFADAYSQPSDGYYGRRLTVTFDSTNIYQTTSGDGYFSDSVGTSYIPVVLKVYGATTETNPDGYEKFSFDFPGQSKTGQKHFTSFTGVQFQPANKISVTDAYGAVDIKEALPINYFDLPTPDGYTSPYVQFTAFGGGIFLFETSLKELTAAQGVVPFSTAYADGYFTFNQIDGYTSVDPGYGEYEFTYAAPFQMPLKTAPKQLYIGNSVNLTNAADGVMDEVKITSATATKIRTRKLAGSYDISVEATSPVFSEPDAKTLVLLHMDDNTQSIINALRDPLDTANLPDSTLATIVSLRNDRVNFINYVNSLHLTGSIVDESVDIRPVSEQLYDLVSVLNGTVNSAKYYKLAGNYFPSEIVVNGNFKYAAVFSGEKYFIEKPGIINNNQGSIELWIAPLANLLGDFNRRVYLDSINHAVIGQDGKLISVTSNLIKFPNNIVAQQINSIRLADPTGQSNTFDFVEFSFLSGNGQTITLTEDLPANNTAVIVDYIPLTTSNDRLTLFKDEGSNLVFSISASGTLYQTSRDISNWKRNEWHRVMITWKTNDKNSLDHLNMFVDGTESTIIKYGEGFLFNTFEFKQEFQTNVNTKVIPQNIQFVGTLDKLYIGTDYAGNQAGLCRMANIRVSFIERQPVIDARGFKIDFDFDGGSKSATPETVDAFTAYLEDFNPQAGFITKFASAQNPVAGAHDLRIIVRDDFHLVRGVDNGQIERLLKELIKIIKPAEARTRISITTNG